MIEYLYNLSTSEISDALDSCGIEGALPDIVSYGKHNKIAGPIFTVKYELLKAKPDDYQMPNNYIDNVPAGSIIVIDNSARTDITVWGDILSLTAVKNNITGTIVNGAIRDIEAINQLGYSVFAKSVYMRSGKNRVAITATQCQLQIAGVVLTPGDYILADCNGVIVIPQKIATEVIEKAKNIQQNEKLIKQSVELGFSLKEARKKYSYHTPWLPYDKLRSD